MKTGAEVTGPTPKKRALHYAKQGYQVIPLHTPLKDGSCSCGKRGCGSVGKHPRTPQGLKDASTDPAQINQWWTYWPDANIGIVTGVKSGIIVIDVDEGGDETLQRLQDHHGPLPKTVTALTGGGGKHIYFKHPGPKTGNRTKFAPSLDVRGDGGYVVAPPSLHKSGGQYRWEGGAYDPTHLAECPDWLLTLVRERSIPQAQPKAEKDNSTSTGRPVLNGVTEGQRNDTLFRLACAYRKKGLTEDESRILILVQNERCQPPLPDREVQQLIDSAYKYGDGDRRAGKLPEIIKDAGTVFFVKEPEHADEMKWLLKPGSTVALIPDKLSPKIGRLFADKEVVLATLPDDEEDEATAKLMGVMLKYAKSVKHIFMPFGNMGLDSFLKLENDPDPVLQTQGRRRRDLRINTLYSILAAVTPELIMRRIDRALPTLMRPFLEFYDLEDLPERNKLIRPWLDEGDLVLLSAPSGAGKTWFAMEVAACLDRGRTGMDGLWVPEKAVPVLYIDGEMHWKDIVKRGSMLSLHKANILSKAELEYRDVSTPLNIANENVRKLLEREILDRDCKLVILDNLFSLATGFDHNQASDWEIINLWLLRLRSKGIAVILVHHTGKGGDQLGTSSREFNVNLSLKLEPHGNAGGSESVAFTIAIKKQRSMGLELTNRLFTFEGGQWIVSEVEQADSGREDPKPKVAELLCEGRSNKDIAEELALTPGRISQIKGQLLDDGILEKNKGQSEVKYSLTDKGNQWVLENSPPSYTQTNHHEGEERTV